jgi:hypothetical protein
MSATRFGKARQAVEAEVLWPKGFTKGNNLYVRHVGDQLHGLYLQRHDRWREYCINLCFHYDFVPGIVSQSRDFRRFDFLDFGWGTRLGFFLEPHVDTWWSFRADVDPQTMLRCLREKVCKGIALLDEFGAQWRDPAVFLDLIPPDLLARTTKHSNGYEYPAVCDKFRHWHWTPNPLFVCYFLVGICVRLGKADLAIEYAKIALAYDILERRRNAFLALLREGGVPAEAVLAACTASAPKGKEK